MTKEQSIRKRMAPATESLFHNDQKQIFADRDFQFLSDNHDHELDYASQVVEKTTCSWDYVTP